VDKNNDPEAPLVDDPELIETEPLDSDDSVPVICDEIDTPNTPPCKEAFRDVINKDP
jgi:hypothetical protein